MELNMTEWKTMVYISASSQRSIAAEVCAADCVEAGHSGTKYSYFEELGL